MNNSQVFSVKLSLKTCFLAEKLFPWDDIEDSSLVYSQINNKTIILLNYFYEVKITYIIWLDR